MFPAVPHPSSGAHNCTYSFRYCQPILLLAATVGEMELLWSFLNLFIFTDALNVSGGSSAHHQEHITVHTVSGIVKPILLPAATVEEMEPLLSSISSTVAASSSIGWQYLKLYVQLCAPDDRAEEPPETFRASVKINKFIKRCILLVVICNSSFYQASITRFPITTTGYYLDISQLPYFRATKI